jgi:hypothetical protein
MKLLIMHFPGILRNQLNMMQNIFVSIFWKIFFLQDSLTRLKMKEGSAHILGGGMEGCFRGAHKNEPAGCMWPACLQLYNPW